MAAPAADVVLSPDSKQARDMAEGLAKQQALIRAAQLGGGDKAQTKWIMDVPLEGAKTASRLLGAMMSDTEADEVYIFPNKIIASNVINFIASARIYGPDDIPSEAAKAKAWAEPWIQTLNAQAHKEGEYFSDTVKRQLFHTSSKDEDGDSKGDQKVSKDKEVNQLLAKYAKVNKSDCFNYFEGDPSSRLSDKLILKFDQPAHGVLIVPPYDELAKAGFASPPRAGCEAEVSLVRAGIGMMLIRYRHELPPDTQFGSYDDNALTFIQEVPDANGGYKQSETKVFFDIKAYSAYCRQCHWPAEKIQDKNKRLAIAKKMWSEIMAECSRLGNRSLTSVFYKLASSHVFIEAEDLVNAEHRASTSSAGGGSSDKTPAKKQRSERNQSNSDPPKGKCRAWCKGVPCKFSDKSLAFDCLKYKHDSEDFGRWPNLHLPSGAGAKSRADA